jgi:hypothetical protein
MTDLPDHRSADLRDHDGPKPAGTFGDVSREELPPVPDAVVWLAIGTDIVAVSFALQWLALRD